MYYLTMKKSFLLLLCMSALLKIVAIAASFSISNFDHESYRIIGTLTQQGTAIYPSPADLRHPYFPFFLYVEALAVSLSSWGIDPVVFLKLVYLPFDFGIAWMVFLLSKKNYTATALYAVNPVTLLVTYVHGQFDVIPLFFLLSAVYAIQAKNNLGTLLHLSMAIFTKTWPVLFIVPFIRRVRPIQLWIFLPVIPLLGTLLYAVLFTEYIPDILLTIKEYRGLYGFWGVGQAVMLITGLEHAHSVRGIRVLFFAAWAWFSLYINRDSILEELTLLFLFFYAFSFGFASQYFCWIIPFLILTRPPFWKWYLTCIPIYLLIVCISWVVPVSPVIFSITGIVSWLAIVYMFFRTLRNSFSYNYNTHQKHSSDTMLL